MTNNIANMTPAQLRALVKSISAANPAVEEAIKKVDISKLTSSGQSKADVLMGYMSGKGLLSRVGLVKKLYPEMDLEAPEALNTQEYRKASRNLSSVLNKLKNTLGERLYSYGDKFAILTEDEVNKLHEFHTKIGQKMVIRRKK